LGAYDLTVNSIIVGKGGGAVATNTALGNGALNSNTTGGNNTAIGYLSLISNTTGVNNTSVGKESLYTNTTGGNNVANGYQALNKNTTGGDNTAIGNFALSNNTTASSNIAVGGYALFNNTTGTYNTSVGFQVNINNTTGSNITAIGFQANTSNTTGNDNTAVGYQALAGNTTGYYNTVLGKYAGQYITTGNSNTIIGAYAGTAAMSSNVILSDGAGNIRFQWDGTNIKLNGNTVGSNAYTSIAYLPLSGGTLTGALSGTSATFSDSANTILTLNSTNSNGYTATQINYSGAAKALIGFGTYLTTDGGVAIRTAASTPFTIAIGGATPTFTLASSGAATFSSSVTATTQGLNSAFNAGAFIAYASGSTTKYTQVGFDATNTYGWIQALEQGVAYRNLILNGAGGNVGIGTASPSDTLQLGSGTANVGLVLYANNGSSGWAGRIQAVNATGAISFQHRDNSATYTEIFSYNANSGTAYAQFAGKTIFNQVGIGTTSPQSKLHVLTSSVGGSYYGQLTIEENGEAALQIKGLNYSSIYFSNASSPYQAGIVYNFSANRLELRGSGNSTALSIASSGNVGIGTTAPGYKLEIQTNATSAGLWVQTGGTTSSYVIADFRTGTNASALQILGNANVVLSSLGTGLVYSSSGTLTSTNPSDSRLKSDIKSITYGLNDILKLRPVSYNWKEDKINQGLQFGFIAQEVQEVMPEAIKEFGDETKFLGLEKDAIYATLVNAIKELNKKIETLENK
jgi:hypothetical protein